MIQVPMENDAQNRQMISRFWIHAREEDVGNEIVYRTDDYDFPPSRGRDAIQLCEDGCLIEHSPGPTDRPVSMQGRWSLVGDSLTLYRSNETKPRVLRIKAISTNYMVLERG